jgi:prolyl oligopeptidase PreP (S9A serine peptidase family)
MITFGSSIIQEDSSAIIANIDGSAFVIDEFGKERRLTNGSKISMNEIIYTSDNSIVNIIFPNKSNIRLNSKSRIKLNTKNSIEVLNGQIWAFTGQKLFISINNSVFVLNNSSGDFILKDNHYEISSWRHNINMFIATGDKKINLILPTGHRVFFSQSQLKEDLSLLRLSKLRKELHIHKAKIGDWENKNLNLDKEILIAIEGDYYNEIYSNDFGFSAGIIDTFLFSRIFNFSKACSTKPISPFFKHISL